MTAKTVEDCDCFGWGSEYTVTAGHRIHCEHRVAKPELLNELLGNTLRDIVKHWQNMGASRLEALESAHYVISNLKTEVIRSLGITRSQK